MKFLVTAILSLFLFIPVIQAQVAPPVQSAAIWKPQKFEPYLKQYPADEKNREYALKWYGYGNYLKSLDKLKHHTFLMVRYHPASRSIVLVKQHHNQTLQPPGLLAFSSRESSQIARKRSDWMLRCKARLSMMPCFC